MVLAIGLIYCKLGLRKSRRDSWRQRSARVPEAERVGQGTRSMLRMLKKGILPFIFEGIMIQSTSEPSLQLTVHRCTGSVAISEIADIIQKFYKSTPTLHVLWDFTHADVSAIKSGEIEALARVVAQNLHSREGGKNAILSPQDVSFGLSRIYQSFAELKSQMTQTKVFRKEEEAREWLMSPMEK